MKNIVLGIVLWTVLVLAIIIGWLLVPATFWRYLFFLRVPILMGLLLLGLPAIAKFILPAMLKNLFVLRGRWQLVFTILGAIAAAMAVVLVAYITLHNAPARFNVPALPEIPQSWQYTIAIALALPTWIAVTDLSHEELKEKRWTGLFVGILSSVIFLLAFDWIRDWLTGNVFLNDWLVAVISLLAKQSTKGYLNPQTGQLTDDHINAFAFFLVLLSVYLFIFIAFKPRPTRSQREAPALLYAMLLLSVATLFLGSLTFYFDYFRFSVLFFWLLTSTVMYWLFKVEHFFELKEDSLKNKSTDRQLKDFKTVIDKRLQHQNQEKTLVVVCASGGGIQAAGWTIRVLTGLQDEGLLGSSFTKAIGLISAVSGGSVGTMYYLDRFGSQGYPENTEQEKDKIFNSATQDSLDAIGWGLAYPDWWRIIALPLFPSILTPTISDRSIALEIDWQGEMKGWEKETKDPKTKKSLATWRKQILQGEIPIPIFNATLIEDGFRLLLSPMTFGESSEQKYFDFNSLYGDYDIDVVTAARLSAAFPYVSPICRNNKDLDQNHHVADGGYFDNSGFVTAVEWLNEWLDPQKNLKIERVLILQINAFPKPSSSNKVNGNRGFFMATVGPLLTLFKVRDPILTSRNCTEIELLQKRWEKQTDIQYFSIYFPSQSEAPEFYSQEGQYRPPLSWKLTSKEKQAIKEGWKTIKNQAQIQELKTLWRDDWGMRDG
jgi:Patatin-like phospholipase